ncbi:hypothetical protein SLA2020_011880 [Shorea laevis]
MAALAPPSSSSSSLSKEPFSTTTTVLGHKKLGEGGIQKTQFRLWISSKTRPSIKLKASMEPPGLVQELKSDELESVVKRESGSDLFDEMKYRFMSFKRKKYMENLEHYQNLAKAQAPKFMVIACADSRVCPSYILGFQPGEAFVVRNVANMVPPYEGGPSETNAALEFAVNSLKVENILVIGHSCCGGIHALMSMPHEEDSTSFIRRWVVVGRTARLNTEAATSNLSFDQQCRHCEKESVNCSLLNLLTYPWIEEKVRKGLLSVHGGYYDFVECTFEKWTLEYDGGKTDESNRVAVKNRSFWR